MGTAGHPGLCDQCADRLDGWLRDLPDYVHALTEPLDMPCCPDHATPPPRRGALGQLAVKAHLPYQPSHPNPARAGDIPAPAAGQRVGGSRERPLPGGADRLSWLGPAADVHHAADCPICSRWVPIGPNLYCLDADLQTGPAPLASVLTGWARMAAEALAVHVPPRTVADLLGFLFRWHGEIVKQPWSDDYAREVHRLWSTARRMAGEAERWVRIGACIRVLDDGLPCGETLSARPEARVIRCPQCGADWARELWLLLGAAIEGVGA
jgi:hypothetical protein